MSLIAACVIVMVDARVTEAQDWIVKSSEISQLQVLERLDRDRDGILRPNEIPVEVRPFVISAVTRFHSGRNNEPFRTYSRATPIDLNELKRLAANFKPDPKEVELVSHVIRDVPPAVYSRTLVAVHDQDRDGVLSGEESRKLGPGFFKWDLDRDGKISPAEVAVRMKMLGNGAIKISAGNSRLDTPRAFSELDTNMDGQIQMHEFNRVWNDENVAHFFQHDRNQDGVITLQEWMQHQVETESKSSATIDQNPR